MLWPWSKRAEPNALAVGALASPSPELFAALGGTELMSGASVTPRTALRCTAVAAAVRAIAEPMGALPFPVYVRGEGNARERDPEHPAHKLLNGQANPWTSAADLRRQVTTDALLHGNGFAVVVRINGVPTELHRLNPEAVAIDTDTGEPVYRYGTGASQQRFGWQDVIHIRAPLSYDGIKGESPVTLAREAIGLAMAMERHGAGLFGNGARPSGTLTHPGKLSIPGLESLKASWQSAAAGSSTGKTAILEEGMKFEALTFKSTDAEFLANRKFAIDEIARAFGVPPHLLFEMGRATWGNSEEMGQSFVTYSLLGWIQRWETGVARVLFNEDESRTYFAEILVDGLLRGDFSKRSEGYAKLIAARVLSPNEARAMEGRPPYEGGDVFANPNTTQGGGGSEPAPS